MRPMIAVIGNGDADPDRDRLAEELGRAIAQHGCGIVCGGLGGVMEAACRGARDAQAGVPVVAIIPGIERSAANPYADVVIATGLGYARNLLVVSSADAVVAVGGASGTLSEIAHAWQLGKPLCALAGTPGWAARLAGESLDSKRSDAIFEAHDVTAVRDWLRAVVPIA